MAKCQQADLFSFSPPCLSKQCGDFWCLTICGSIHYKANARAVGGRDSAARCILVHIVLPLGGPIPRFKGLEEGPDAIQHVQLPSIVLGMFGIVHQIFLKTGSNTFQMEANRLQQCLSVDPETVGIAVKIGCHHPFTSCGIVTIISPMQAIGVATQHCKKFWRVKPIAGAQQGVKLCNVEHVRKNVKGRT